MLFQVQDHQLYAYTGGKAFDANLPTVVFIHGAQNDHSVWGLQSRYLAHHGYSVLAIDLPGHGRSRGKALTSVEAMADCVLAVLDTLGVRIAHLIGHSMGSLIALEACSRAPDRVKTLALLGTAFPMKVSDTLLEAALNTEQNAIDMVNIWSHSGYAQKPSCPGPGFSVIGGSRRLMQYVSRHSDEKLFHIDFTACNTYANGLDAASKVNCPTLFLLGKRDIMTPVKASGGLAKAIAASGVQILENCGHDMMAEQPDAVLDHLIGLLASK